MGWRLPSLILKRYNLCNHMVGRGQTSRQRVFVFAFFHVHRRLCFCQSAVSICGHWPAAGRGAVPGTSCWQPLQPNRLALARLPRSLWAPPEQQHSRGQWFECFAAFEPCVGISGRSQPQHWLATLPWAHGTLAAATAGESSSLFRGQLCYTTCLQWWIPPETCGTVAPSHQHLASNLRAGSSLSKRLCVTDAESKAPRYFSSAVEGRAVLVW